MRESSKRFFFTFCAILGLLLAAISAGGWITWRQLELDGEALSGPAPETVAGHLATE